jgi:hypothetical protein
VFILISTLTLEAARCFDHQFVCIRLQSVTSQKVYVLIFNAVRTAELSVLPNVIYTGP